MSEHDEREDYDDLHYTGPLARRGIAGWPGSLMWVFGVVQLIAVQLVLGAVAFLYILMGIVDDGKSVAEVGADVLDSGNWVGFVAWPVLTAGPIIVIVAANNFRRFRRYQLVVAGAILTLLAFPFFYLAIFQLPLGIWLIVILLRRDVRARFEAVDRGAIPTPSLPSASSSHSEGD